MKENSITGMKTGFIDLDKSINGLNNSDLIILAARPAMGKTSFALNLLLNITKLENKSVLFFSLEMSKSQLYQRLLSIETDIHLHNIKNKFLDDDARKKIEIASSNLSKSNIFIEDSPNISVLEIEEYAKKIKNNGKLGLIIVDYLQLIKSGDNSQQEISDISRSLKSLARELDIPIIVLSQLSRNIENRVDKRPKLSDLKGIGGIEKYVDMAIFLYRDDYYNSKSDDKGIAEVIIAKQRNGSTGTVKLLFLNEITKFENFIVQMK